VLPEDVKEMFHQDLDSEVSKELGKDLRPHSLGSFWGTTTYAAWRQIPTTYVICNKDRPSTIQAIHYLISTAKSGAHKVDNVIEVDAGHSVFISKPQWTAEILIAEASKA
jgi:pimeloyl-ACP methyl ester carboxylesterase